ncbi:MAG: heat-inducible transcriptional repressor HrcA [Gudongella sp.]|jgi:heat-inducible transcriptional repressor|nr:heat-inducible transcriptional repressor HrcA [Gudongella sp.]
MLDDRKFRVLYAIIDSYISSAEPIGSRTISKYYDLGVSPATIRNEMSDLEELGFLNKTHTSSGRVPSDKAYRLYVDTLVQSKVSAIDKKWKQEIQGVLSKESKELDQLIQNAGRLLSKITNYTSLAISPQLSETKIRHIQLLPIDDYQVLLIIVNESGVIKNTVFKMNRTIPEHQLTEISNILNEKLKNKTFQAINRDLAIGIYNEFSKYKEDLEGLLPFIGKSVNNIESTDLYTDGLTQLLNYPEYRDIEKAKSIISAIEDKDQLIEILQKGMFSSGIDVMIGEENIYEPLRECSIITTTYKFNGETIGRIGIIGPTRMDYAKLIATLKVFSDNISEVINNYNLTDKG